MYFYKLNYISSNCFMLNIKTSQNVEKPKPSRIKASNFIRVIRKKNLFVFFPLCILKFTFWSKNYIGSINTYWKCVEIASDRSISIFWPLKRIYRLLAFEPYSKNIISWCWCSICPYIWGNITHDTICHMNPCALLHRIFLLQLIIHHYRYVSSLLNRLPSSISYSL